MPQALPQVLLAHLMADSLPSGPEFELRLLACLADLAPQMMEATRPYGKMAGWHECTIQLFPANVATFHAVLARAKHWTYSNDDESDCGDRSAIWNRVDGESFLLPEITWVHILLVTPNPPSPDQEYLAL